MNAIKAENLTYVYSPNTPFEKAAIQDINLEIEQGEFVLSGFLHIMGDENGGNPVFPVEPLEGGHNLPAALWVKPLL